MVVVPFAYSPPPSPLQGRVREGGEGKSEVKLNHDRPYRPWISAARR